MIALGVLLVAAPAVGQRQDARKQYEQATAAFGLGHYGEAAEHYEAAFRVRPDPAFLYNAAQAYRLDGNKARALELYRNYVRLYGAAPNVEDARAHVVELEGALNGRVEAAPASTAPEPPPALPLPRARESATAGAPGSLPAAAAASPAPVAAGPSVSAPAPDLHLRAPPTSSSDGAASADGSPSVLRRPWFWGVLGAVVAGGVLAVVLTRGGDKDPSASLGVVTVGN